MRYYLVDLENVPKSLNNLIANKDTKKCNLVVFYSENQQRRVASIKENLNHVFKSVDYLYIEEELHNALDFNLVCYIGKILGSFKGKNLELFIVSEDKGYHAIQNFINSQTFKYKLSVDYISDIQKVDCHLDVSMSVLTLLIGSSYPNYLKNRVLSSLYQRLDVIELIKKHMLNGKYELWQSLTTTYGEKAGSKFYNLLKTTYIKDLCL